MSLDRRHLMTAAGAGLAAGLTATVTAAATPSAGKAATKSATLSDLGIVLDAGQDVSAALQTAIDQTASHGVGLRLPPGTFAIGRPIYLRPGAALSGALGATTLAFGNGAGLIGQAADNLRIEDLALDGAHAALDTTRGVEGLLSLDQCANIRLSGLELRRSAGNGLVLKSVSGSVENCRMHQMRRAGLFSLDGRGVRIAANDIQDCGDNGILVWTTQPAECGTIVQGNRIERIAAKSGGTGQNGNGINVYRAAGVLVANNRITDCAYSAIRGNAASNIQMIANSCARLGRGRALCRVRLRGRADRQQSGRHGRGRDLRDQLQRGRPAGRRARQSDPQSVAARARTRGQARRRYLGRSRQHRHRQRHRERSRRPASSSAGAAICARSARPAISSAIRPSASPCRRKNPAACSVVSWAAPRPRREAAYCSPTT